MNSSAAAAPPARAIRNAQASDRRIVFRMVHRQGHRGHAETEKEAWDLR
jgi:hypothetical protein